jgi:hypothetical protein
MSAVGRDLAQQAAKDAVKNAIKDSLSVAIKENVSRAVNEEISKSKNIFFMDRTTGIDFSVLDFEYLNTELNELYPNSVAENIYLY